MNISRLMCLWETMIFKDQRALTKKKFFEEWRG